MKTVVITGSTRGIGYGLAHSFLRLGHAVTVNGRSTERVHEAVDKLCTQYDKDYVLGFPCDVTHFKKVQALWDAAKDCFGRIDVWINNAGLANDQKEIWKHSPEEVEAVIDTNLLGAIYGSIVAVRGMLGQGLGAIYNMEGMGSDGRRHQGLSFYGMSKYGLHYFTQCLVDEVKGTPLIVGSIRPGMVVTDMISRQFEGRPKEWERAKRIFNLLADRIETVTPWLAQQIVSNMRSGVCISWMTRGKLLRRFLTAPFVNRNLFD